MSMKLRTYNPDNIDFKVTNKDSIIFQIDKSKFWFLFTDCNNAYEAHRQAISFANFHNASTLNFCLLENVDRDEVISIYSERGMVTSNIYSFRRLNKNFDSPLIYEYLSEYDVFGK